MKLSIFCGACEKYIPVTSQAINRQELENEIGRYFNIKCPHCGKVHANKHVNDVKAKVNPQSLLVAVAVAGLITFISWHYLGFMSVLTSAIPFILAMKERSATDGFNQYRVSKRSLD